MTVPALPLPLGFVACVLPEGKAMLHLQWSVSPSQYRLQVENP